MDKYTLEKFERDNRIHRLQIAYLHGTPQQVRDVMERNAKEVFDTYNINKANFIKANSEEGLDACINERFAEVDALNVNKANEVENGK